MFGRRVPWLRLLLGVVILAGAPNLAPGQSPTNAVPPDKALILVRLPAAAKLTIAGDPTMKTGPERLFITPSIPAGKSFRYKLVATWTEGGKERKLEYTVRFMAGRLVVADLNAEAARQSARPTDKDRAKPKDLDKAKPADKDKPKPDDKDKPKDKDKSEKLPAPKTEAKDKPDDKPKPKPDDKPKPKPDDKDKDKPKPDDKDKSEKLPAPKTEVKDKPKPDDKEKDKGKPDVKAKATEKLPAPKTEAKDKDGDEASARTRTFEFTYAATVTGLEAKKKVKMWAPVATSSDAQDVQLLSSEVKSGEENVKGQINASKRDGNKFFFVETTPNDQGKISLKLIYKVTRREVKGQTAVKEDAAQLTRLLQADALVPISGKPLELIEDKELPADPMKKARVLYDTVREHMTYSKKGDGWGRGDSVWACDSKYGNCSDFHSLFISLARAEKMPAKFEIGFMLPAKHGEGSVAGYHCWAFFRPAGKGWVPVDISEASKNPKQKDYYFGNLTADRLAFSSGRDLELVPRQAGKPVNFLVCPYVEVDSKEHPQAKIEKHFAYKDLK